MTEHPMDQILPAVVAAMGDVKKLGKGERNKHDGYNFASIDDFLALVNPICADRGLVVVSEEVAIDDFMRQGRSGESPWMRVTFRFTVYHTSGQHLPPASRTVEVLRNGAQAYGSAQSFALKQFLRALFLIATGDKDDADYQRTDDGVIARGAPPTRQERQPPPRDPGAAAAAMAELASATSLDSLAAVWREMPPGVKAAPEVIATKDARKAALSAPPGPVPTYDATAYAGAAE
jgi:hypothetical protein